MTRSEWPCPDCDGHGEVVRPCDCHGSGTCPESEAVTCEACGGSGMDEAAERFAAQDRAEAAAARREDAHLERLKAARHGDTP